MIGWKGAVAKVCLGSASYCEGENYHSQQSIEAEAFHLPIGGHDQKFPVICLSHQVLAIHRAADLLHFPSLSSYFGRPFCPQEKVKGVGNTISIDP